MELLRIFIVLPRQNRDPPSNPEPAQLKPELTAAVELSDMDHDGDLDVLIANMTLVALTGSSTITVGNFTHLATIGTVRTAATLLVLLIITVMD